MTAYPSWFDLVADKNFGFDSYCYHSFHMAVNFNIETLIDLNRHCKKETKEILHNFNAKEARVCFA